MLQHLLANRPTVDLHALTQRARRQLDRLPVLRRVNYELAPPYFVGSVIENRLGYQVARALGRQIGFSLRPRHVPAHLHTDVTTLERDGILVRPSWLSGEALDRVRADFERATTELEANLEPVKGQPHARLHAHELDASRRADEFPAAAELIQRDPWLNELTEVLLRRRIEFWPELRFQLYRVADPNAPDGDIENVLHADHHLPTYKAFIYLDDVPDETSGPFVYAPGSHRLTLARLAHEYDISRRVARQRAGHIEERLVAWRGSCPRPIVDPTRYDALGIQERPLCAPAGSLVLANTMGFHRRGAFGPGVERRTILANFRFVESIDPDGYAGPRKAA